MTLRRALLFPEIPAVLTEDEGSRLCLVDFASRRTLRAEGAIGRELASMIEGGPTGPLGARLPQLAETAGRLRASESVPLTPEAALRLQGFETLFLELTLQCTERCRHCYASAGPERPERLSRELALAALEDAAALGFSSVQLTGGDPLLCPFLDELLAAAARLGFETREVFTNGLLLDEGRLAALSGQGASLAVSLYSADPERHDRVTRVPGSHRRTCDAIARASAGGVAVRVAVVALDAEGAAGVEATVALARSLGAGLVQASASHAVGRGGYLEAAVPSGDAPADDSAAPADEAACGREGAPHRGVLCVAADGVVYPCVFNRTDRLGRLSERPLREIVASPEPAARAEDPEAFLREVRTRLQCVSCQCTAWALRQCEGAG